MEKLNFRYDKSTKVSITNNGDNLDICFFENGDSWPTYFYRFRPYFKEISFKYKDFDVKCTAKDGSAFIAGYRSDTYYAIRKKKRKNQILFVKNNNLTSKYKVGEDGVKTLCLLDGVFTDNKDILDDFLEKRVYKQFDEEKYLASLDEEDRLDYLDDKRVYKVVDDIVNKYGLDDDQDINLYMFIKNMEDKTLREKLLSGNFDYSSSVIRGMIKKSNMIDFDGPKIEYKVKDFEYTIDDKYIFTEFDFADLNFSDMEEKYYVLRLYWTFLDEYEDIKDYYKKSIDKVKSSIDSLIPYFEKFCNK